ncbi:alpha-amylase family glycosyl hydrolase [Lysobacter niastensis]|uniref:Glycosyl hydrolase family 13 catalytic domain-containing protein n=1 Tax=Lysobacter niastensis TaxID=380629 RepID=A0ABS0B8R1_9GAMM|nr:alpha-amylase family glycosyl hydrolase [Lysobacter niastensis]MBF6025298.1 hypothetical protein [Lysobacter niastensis]
MTGIPGRRGLHALALASLFATAGTACAATPGPLHVPSPDWRDQVIYFVMTDRFADGDPRNNDQGAGEYDPSSNAKYNGGDLRGVEQRLDYIRGLGVTAVWVTPPVANEWWSTRSQYGGYHGYWAENLMAVDAHNGSLDDYRSLSRSLHGRGMYLVQDVVVNHMGNYFTYDGGWSADDPAAHFRLNADSRGRTAPTQSPFDRNDARDPAQRTEAIYHWTPAITDYNDPRQVHDYQLADLDDLNTENPRVREALRRSYGYWIREAGVDAFRVDTAFYVAPEYFDDFLHADDPAAPGIARVAAKTGRRQFHVFGEGFGLDPAFQDGQMRRIDGYMRDAVGRELLPGMINFPLYGSFGDVFARGRPTAELGWRIERTMQLHREPHLMPTFVDNHDVDRFLAGGDEAGLRQALLAMLTLPGIPTIYYGTEQGLREQRAAMFAAGYGSGGRDHYDTQAPLYRYLQRAIALRREHRVFSRGTPRVVAQEATGPGALAWTMRREGETALVALNTASHTALLEPVDTGLAPGTVLRGAFAIEGNAPELVVDAHGRVSLPLPARSGYAWLPTPERRTATAPARVALDAALPRDVRGDFAVSGAVQGASVVKLVVDGDIDRAREVRADAQGRWQAQVDTTGMTDADVPHRVVAWDPSSGAVSAPHAFRVAREWKVLADVKDPDDDDRGPSGRYVYPAAPEWHEQRPLDLSRIRVLGAGGAMKVEVTTRSRLATWNPPNGFDHIAYTLFVGLPDREDGATVMPQQNGTLPDGMRWQLRARAHGWTNALFVHRGATATADGTAITPAASIALGPGEDTVTFTFPASVLGSRRSLSGVRVVVNTWDYDGGYRGLTPQAGPHTIGGGDGSRDPLWMDDSGVITLP